MGEQKPAQQQRLTQQSHHQQQQSNKIWTDDDDDMHSMHSVVSSGNATLDRYSSTSADATHASNAVLFSAVFVFCFGIGLVMRTCTRRGMKRPAGNRARARLRALPTFAWDACIGAPCGGASTSTECALCLETYGDGEQMRLLPCGHVYHAACIDKWLFPGPHERRVPAMPPARPCPAGHG